MNRPPAVKFLVLFAIGVLCAAHSVAQNVTNYSFSATTGAFTVIQGTAGATSPALSGGGWDDGWFNTVPIGFPFVFEGAAYTTLAASTNGWAKLGGPVSSSFLTNDLNIGTARPVVAPLWDDNYLTPGGFTYITTGVAPNRVCTLEWLGVEWNYTATSSAVSFQVKLYEATKRIEYIYRQEAGTVVSASASIGISGVTSGQFLSLNGTGASPVAGSVTETSTLNIRPATGQIYRFDHYTVVPKITSLAPVTGVVSSLITITGTGFEATPILNVVYCGAVKATVFSATTTQLLVTVPLGTNYDHVTVTSVQSNLTAESNESYDVMYSCGSVVTSTSLGAIYHTATSSNTRPVVIHDIDGDGKPDVVAGSDLAGGTARVFRNTSTGGPFIPGSLAPPVDFIVADQPANIIFSDVDGDGKKDMITACYSVFFQDSITLYRNTSTTGIINSSSFGPKVKIKSGHYPYVAFGDINGDGKPEMVNSCRGNNIVEIRQNQSTVGSITTGSFGAVTNFATAVAPQSVAVGDIDGDDKPDVVTANANGASVSVLRNAGLSGPVSGLSLEARVDFPGIGLPGSVKLGDIDGDGMIDVVVADISGNQISIFRNTSIPGTVSFAPRVDVSCSGGIYNIDLGDVDGDGKPDVVIANGNPYNLVGVLKNNSAPGVITFAAVINYSGTTNPFDVAVGDLDNDSKPEVVVGQLNGASSFAAIMYNQTTSLNAIAPATVVGTTSFCDNQVWKTYYNPADVSKVLFAVKDNGNNLGTITVDEYRDAAPGIYNGQRFLQRHFKITPASQPATPVQVRLYFTNAELANLMAVDPSVTGIGSLSVTKYNGPTEDATYNPLDATTLTWYSPGSITTGTAYGGRYLEFTINGFSEFWIHGGTGVLPVELVAFNAVPVGETVALDWQTASETNNDYFAVEKTHDGITFETIDT
ncbi:MAG TPA: FG-GAP-like repeat-containing protein, partial [Bacteroidia bacterium]|nr:FG-GAP-like repeat-containing protein [Bacteroidia bacterium]